MSFGVFQFRRGTAAAWTSADPTLEAGEIGLETDTSQIKIGDGATAWTLLGYAGIPGPTGPAGNAPELVEVDAGSSPVQSLVTSVTVTGVTTSSNVSASVTSDMPAGVDADELELEPLLAFARATAVDTVEITVLPARADGSFQGKFNVLLLWG